MKSINELGISPVPWIFAHADGHSMVASLHGTPIIIYDFKDEKGIAKADALLISVSPKLYDRLWRLVNEINKVIDHTPQGDCVIDCDCSGIELAKVEAEEALREASGELTYGCDFADKPAETVFTVFQQGQGAVRTARGIDMLMQFAHRDRKKVCGTCALFYANGHCHKDPKNPVIMRSGEPACADYHSRSACNNGDCERSRLGAEPCHGCRFCDEKGNI